MTKNHGKFPSIQRVNKLLTFQQVVKVKDQCLQTKHQPSYFLCPLPLNIQLNTYVLASV